MEYFSEFVTRFGPCSCNEMRLSSWSLVCRSASPPLVSQHILCPVLGRAEFVAEFVQKARRLPPFAPTSQVTSSQEKRFSKNGVSAQYVCNQLAVASLFVSVCVSVCVSVTPVPPPPPVNTSLRHPSNRSECVLYR